MQLSAARSNNGALVQTEASVALASLAEQLIRRQRRGGGVVRVHVWGSQSQAGSGLMWELRGCSGCGDTAG